MAEFRKPWFKVIKDFLFKDIWFRIIAYALLIAGTVVFTWPFIWMITTSIKTDREMFRENLHMLPDQPLTRPVSPYVEDRYYADVKGPRMAELVPEIEKYLQALKRDWFKEVDRAQLIHQTARGIYHRLQTVLPSKFWEAPLPQLAREATRRIDEEMITTETAQVERRCRLGALWVRSWDLQEDILVAKPGIAKAWKLEGPARLVQVSDKKETHAELYYDLTKNEPVTLSRVFTTSFKAGRLYRVNLSNCADDTWHYFNIWLECNGVLYKGEGSRFFSDYIWGDITWQFKGPDDRSNKIKTWSLLEEVDRGPKYLSDPHKIKITLKIQRNGFFGAWAAKMSNNYVLVFHHVPFFRYVATSVFLVILNMIGVLFSCSLVAYSFARLKWPGRGAGFAVMLGTMMIPGQVTMIPFFMIIRWLGWYNTLYPLWVVSFFGNAFFIFLLNQFLKGIPRDLEDAAKIDGCGNFRIYWSIMLPLVGPALATIAIFTFMGVWRDFMGPLIYLSDQRLYPLSLGLYAFNVQAGSSMSMMMAGAFMMCVPVVVIFFFAQRYFIQGITMTGIKN